MDSPTESDQRYQAFLAEVRTTGKVYTWELEGGLATWSYEEASEPIVLFWSSSDSAEVGGGKHFPDYSLSEFELEDFLVRVLPELERQGSWIGVNWLETMTGVEVAPHALAEELQSAG